MPPKAAERSALLCGDALRGTLIGHIHLQQFVTKSQATNAHILI
jgi:hypothetical protein